MTVNLYLIDGNSYFYRAYYAIRGLSTSGGLPTNAIFGFTNMLMKIIREKKPDGIAISFDSPVPTERHRLFEDYKAHRPETPEDLIQQIPHIRRMISAFNIRIFEMPGYEADDILGTIARRAESEGANVFIVTGDKDMLQLVDNRVRIYDPMKDRVFDKAFVRERYGVGPERITDFLALTGDAVDNIPGIKGVGEKTARELLAEFGSLDDILNNAEKIKRDRLKRLIHEYADMARLSRTLATLNTAVPVDPSIQEFSLRAPDWQALLSLFREFEFGSLMKMIPSDAVRDTDRETVLSEARLRDVASLIRGECAFDTETTGKNPVSAELVGISLCMNTHKAFYVPVLHAYPGAPAQIAKGDVQGILSPVFMDEETAKIGHNIKYDMIVLRNEKIPVNGPLFDTMLASYLLNPNKPNHSLEEVALEHLSYRKKSFPEVLKGRGSFSEVPLEEASAYACDDANLSYELKEILFRKLNENGLEALYSNIEMPLIRVLADMEMSGVKIDPGRLAEISAELEKELDGLKRRIYFLAGEEFNINSPKQLSQILFHTLGFQPGKKTKTGFSTGMNVLEELALAHEFPREVLNYRSMNKLKTTYIDVLPGLINPKTGRIHTSFNQASTATGRLSSSDPNLQNIPVKGEWGRRIRETFIAEAHNLLLSADYSQIELRILAHLSGDEGLVNAFRENLDVHARTASEIFGIPLDRVSPDARRMAKTVNFGVIYGISPYGLSETLNISREDAKTYIAQYFNRHPGVKGYIEKCIAGARSDGYVATLFGRKRAIPEASSKNTTVRQQGERLAVNSPVQGTAADVIKIAMINIWNAFRERDLRARMILQVHDELLFELPEEELATVQNIVKEKMEGVLAVPVPLKVDIRFGKNWAEVHG